MTVKEQAEYDRLAELYQDIPANQRKLVDGLLVEAARLKVSLDELWEDISTNGDTMMVNKGTTIVEIERPSAKIFTSRDKSYRAVIRHLDDLLPSKVVKKGFNKLDDDDEEDDGGDSG